MHQSPPHDSVLSVEIPKPTLAGSLAKQLRGFGPLGLLSILIILLGNALFVPLSAILVLVWARVSGTPRGELGFVRPRSWLASALTGIVFGVAFKLVMKIVVMPLLGAPAVNQAYHYLAGNRAAIPGFLYTLIVGAGFGEETVFRGYFFERFGRIFGTGGSAKVPIVIITSAAFALAHYSVQGVPGTEQAFISGLVFGTVFAFTGSIFMIMCAHAAFDLTAYAIIYNNLETTIAHLLFG